MRKFLFFSLLLYSVCLTAQVRLTDVGARAGGTRTTWNDFFDFNGVRYTANYGWYAGLTTEIEFGTKVRKTSLEAQLNYRFLQVGFEYSPDQLEMSELTLNLRPKYTVKRFTFGLDAGLSINTNKEVHRKGVGRREVQTTIFNEYSSLSGAIEFAIGKSISIELTQSFLHSAVRRFRSCGNGGRNCAFGYNYQRVTQLGLRYSFFKKERGQ